MKYPGDFINQIICSDCQEVMKIMPDNCIDTIITDPPYGLKFMGKKWDYKVPSIEIWQECLRVLKSGGTALIFAGSRTQHRMAVNVEDAGFILKDCIMWIYGSGFPKATDISQILDKDECRKQLEKKLGRKATKEEFKEAWERFRKIIGYEERFGREGRKANCGFKKEYIGAIGTQDQPAMKVIEEPVTTEANLWNGWKSHGLKPAYEPILVAMKPNEGSYANNAMKWGVAGLNIDGGRIGTSDNYSYKKCGGSSFGIGKGIDNTREYPAEMNTRGRFPANVILECICDEVIEGEAENNARIKKTIQGKIGGNIYPQKGTGKGWGNINKKERTQIHTDPNCPCYMLDEMSGNCKSGWRDTDKHKGGNGIVNNFGAYGITGQHFNDVGGASRFFYCAKASKAERNRGCEGLEEKDWNNQIGADSYTKSTHKILERDKNRTNNHPTVKPLSLMKYLVTLTKTPTGGIVLDPFCGSGTTLMACKELKRDYIGIDNIPEYCEIARKRIKAIPELLF